MQGHPDLGALVLRQDYSLLQVEPVVSADSNAQEAQTTYGEDAAQQGQGLPPTGAHLVGCSRVASSTEWALGGKRRASR